MRSLPWLAQFTLLTVVGKYIDPALTLPPTPKLPESLETGYVNLTSADIWYAKFGACLEASLENELDPIVFLHGGFANSDYFGDQISYLTRNFERRTIIAIDSRMQGRSTGINGPISYSLMRQDVVHVLDHFQIPKAVVIGWSDGGIIGLDMAINSPSRLSRLFAFAASYKYTNINATAADSTTFKEYIHRVKVEYRELSPTPNKFPELTRKLDKMFATEPDYTASDFAKIPTLFEHCSTAPLIWVVDAADEEVIKLDVPRTIHNMIPGSGLVILPSVSHFAFLQDPETFDVMIGRFLQYKPYCT